MKENKIIIRLDKDFSDSYFNMCNKEGYTMSKRVRRIMELDITLNELNINSIKELEKIISYNDKHKK
jgi:hypothetical protein